MKHALAFLAALALVACGEDRLTGAQYPETLPTPEQRTVLRGLVVNEDGECIPGATVVVELPWLSGPIEEAAPCPTDAASEDVGFTMEDVRVGVGLTIHASAPGYTDQAMTFVPSLTPVEIVFVRMSRVQELRKR